MCLTAQIHLMWQLTLIGECRVEGRNKETQTVRQDYSVPEENPCIQLST